jgi:hypothetical protein
VLVLTAKKAGKVMKCGNSLDGFKLSGLCANPYALARYLNLVIETTGVVSFDLEGED